MSRRPRNINEVESARLQSRAILAGIEVPPGVELLVTDSRVGRYRSATKTCTVPLWATKRDFNGNDNADFELYYAAHEAAHAWVDHDNVKDRSSHGPYFYKWFKTLCDPKLWHHELGYKTREAKRAGIDPNPLVNLRCGTPLPDTSNTASVVSPVQDDARYDDYINANPKLQRALKARAIPDRDVKSFVRGWAKLDQRN